MPCRNLPSMVGGDVLRVWHMKTRPCSAEGRAILTSKAGLEPATFRYRVLCQLSYVVSVPEHLLS